MENYYSHPGTVTSQVFGKPLCLQPLLKIYISKTFNCANYSSLFLFRMTSIKEHKITLQTCSSAAMLLYACQDLWGKERMFKDV